jgi:beta-lactamase class D
MHASTLQILEQAICLLAFLFFIFCCSSAQSKVLNPEDLGKFFDGYKGSFVAVNERTGEEVRYRPELAAERLPPCSTFKIFNSLVGLDSGVLRDENASFQWDGTKHSIESWNRDQTLQSAVTNSCVWYFQKLATAVGEPRMKEYITRARYGNEDISGGLTKFWLGSTLKISPDEQVQMLKRLLNDELPFSKRSQAIVRGLIRLDQTPKGTLYGKTGSQRQNGKDVLGWFVGYVVVPGDVYIFATTIRGQGAAGFKAKEITRRIFTAMDRL